MAEDERDTQVRTGLSTARDAGGDTAALPLVAAAFARLAELAVSVVTDRRSATEGLVWQMNHDPARALHVARDAMDEIYDTIKDVVERAEAIMRPDTYPTLVHALSTLRAAVAEADQAVDLLSRGGDGNPDGGDATTGPIRRP